MIGQNRVGETERKAGDPGPGAPQSQDWPQQWHCTLSILSAWILSAPSGILEELCDHGLVTQPS